MQNVPTCRRSFFLEQGPLILSFLVGFAVTMVVYFPGYMSADPIQQLKEARAGIYSEWHPPAMAFLWRLFDNLYPGPAVMLILHALLFWSGLSMVSHEIFENRITAALATLLVGFSPPVFAIISTVWKDVEMAVLLLLSISFLSLAQRQNRGLPLTFSILFLCWGVLVRHNALTAVVPILFWMTCLVIRSRPEQPFRRLIQRAACTSVLTFGLFLVSHFVTKALVSKQHESALNVNVQAVMIFDLSALSIDRGTLLYPSYLTNGKPDLSVDVLRPRYHPANCNPLLSFRFIPDSTNQFHFSSNESDTNELSAAWARAVFTHPRTYLRHRLWVFEQLIGLKQEKVWYPFHTGIDPNEFGITLKRGPLNRWVMSLLDKTKNSLLFRSWIYLAMMFLTLGLSFLRSPSSGLYYSLTLSGLLYVIPYFFIVGSADFRYLWWTTLCGILSTLLSLKTWWEAFYSHKLFRSRSVGMALNSRNQSQIGTVP